MKKYSCLSIILIALFSAVTAYPQSNSALLKQAAEFHKNYNFADAIEIYESILQQRPDSTLTTEADSLFNMNVERLMITSENGSSMLLFASEPEAVAKRVFPAENFFLNYPGFEKKSWMAPPAEFSSEKHGNPFNVMNLSKGSNIMVFSAPDESGSWNIMQSKKINDTLWSAPQILNENVTTAGNEILPHLSPDNKTLYFSSDGHYGMGGYDLYASTWDEELGDWGVAQNLGFPYSSTSNDFLFYNTPDGLFSVFASARETSRNELTIYATTYEALPLKQEILQEDAPKAAKLEMSGKTGNQHAEQENAEESAVKQDSEYESYAAAVKEVKELQNMLKKAIGQLDSKRETYSQTTDSLKKIELEQQMLNMETDILTLSQSTTSAVSKLQQIELAFLSKGIIIINEMPIEDDDSDRQMENHPQFAFAQNSIGTTPSFIFEKPEPKIDLEFKILDESVIADIATVPNSLVYHIQLVTTTKKASPKTFKGLSPIFERALASGKYTYSAGLFYSYSEALKNLNTVRKRGFPTAMITAYNNGKSITVKNARQLEAKNDNIYRVTIAGYDILPPEALAVIRENTSRDIAKAAIDGVMKYVIGPFTNKTQADGLAEALAGKQITGVEVEKVENN